LTTRCKSDQLKSRIQTAQIILLEQW